MSFKGSVNLAPGVFVRLKPETVSTLRRQCDHYNLHLSTYIRLVVQYALDDLEIESWRAPNSRNRVSHPDHTYLHAVGAIGEMAEN